MYKLDKWLIIIFLVINLDIKIIEVNFDCNIQTNVNVDFNYYN